MMKNRIILTSLITALLFLSPFARAEMQLKHFNADSYKTILAQYQANAFLMVLWSVDCPPCIEELPTLSKFHQSHPATNIVMISTDSKNQAQEVKHLIKKHGLTNIQQWVFSDDSIQAIRFAIDPLWYGELPRSYFHNDKHKRRGESGRLDKGALLTWFKTVNNTSAGFFDKDGPAVYEYLVSE